MSFKKIVMIVVPLSIAIAGGAVLYVRSNVKRSLEDAITAAAPLAEVRYEGLSVGLDGKVRVFDIRIKPRLINDYLSLESLDIDTPGLWYLLTGTKKLNDGTLPESLRISLRGLTLNNGGAFTDSIDRILAAAAAQKGGRVAANCGDIPYFDFRAYRRLGYQNLVFDVSAGYRFERRALNMKFEWRTRDMNAVTVEMEMNANTPRVNDLIAERPRVRNFTIGYQDLSLVDKLKKYCANANGVSVEQYVDSEMNRSDAAFIAALGFVPGPGLRAAYREFLVQPGEIRVQGTPPEQMDMQALQLFRPDDVVAMLNLRLHVNGKPVTDLSVTVPEKTLIDDKPAPKPAPAKAPAVESNRAETIVPPPAPAPRKAAPTGYRVIPVRDLGRYVNRTVRLTVVRGGTVREGRLVQILGQSARIERRMQGGTMIVAVPLAEITRAEVLN